MHASLQTIMPLRVFGCRCHHSDLLSKFPTQASTITCSGYVSAKQLTFREVRTFGFEFRVRYRRPTSPVRTSAFCCHVEWCKPRYLPYFPSKVSHRSRHATAASSNKYHTLTHRLRRATVRALPSTSRKKNHVLCITSGLPP